MRIGLILSLTAVLSLAGCSDETAGRVDVYPVSGKVTLGGTAPIAGATISFAPQGKYPVAIGKTDDNGEFTMTTYEWADGAAPGTYDVLISKNVSTSGPVSSDEVHATMQSGGRPPSHDSKKKKGGQEGSMINAKYGKKGTLKAEVTKDGPNELQFDLDP